MPGYQTPFGELEDVFARMSEKLEETSKVSVDVAEDDDEITVTADLPGYDREDIDVNVEDNRLTITAEREREEEEDEEYHRRERSFRRHTRTIRLPARIDVDAASATYENGVLEVTLPKIEEQPGHSVEIE